MHQTMPRLKVPTADHLRKFPPLTDDEVRVCEADFGLRFPQALIDLLKEQNGGYFENSDFKIQGTDLTINEVIGISSSEKWGRLQPLSRILDPENFPEEDLAEIRDVIGDLSKIIPFDGDGHYYYALDYNRLNRSGEPTVLYLDIEGGASCRKVTDSFAELLAAQYEGDAQPAVRMEEADKLKLIAAGEYSGTREGVPQALRHSWKICLSGRSIIVLSAENHGWGVQYHRYEAQKSSLDLIPGRLADLGEELDPELAELIQPSLESPLIDQWAEGLTPTCYQLRLPVDPQKRWVKHQTSAPYGGKWKNTSGEIVYASVYSSSRSGLEEALAAVKRSCA
jgi:hypothetical protein